MNVDSLKIKTFNIQIESFSQHIDLDKLSKDFILDTSINSEKTKILQNNEVVSYSNIDAFKKFNKKIGKKSGFSQLTYSKNLIKKQHNNYVFNKPPIGPIPNGLWCNNCYQNGPNFHLENCYDPSKFSLYLNLLGLIFFLENKKKLDHVNISTTIVSNFIDDFQNKIGNINHTKEEYINILDIMIKNNEEYRTLIYEEINENEWPKLNIAYYDVIEKPEKKKNPFDNCVIVSHIFQQDKSTSIRIYNKGTIFIVSCPWSNKKFYNKVLDRINDSESVFDSLKNKNENYEINMYKSGIKSVFSIFKLTDENSNIDLEKVYNFLWPTSDGLPIDIYPKETFIKEYEDSKEKLEQSYLYFSIRNKKIYYRFTIEYKSHLDTKKIILKLVPCVLENNTPIYCKPCKITMMIFNSGVVETIYSMCNKEKDNLCDEVYQDLSDSIEKQSEAIEKELNSAKDFVSNILLDIRDEIILERPEENKSAKIINTVTGIVQYNKPLKFKTGMFVDIFNIEEMIYDKYGKIIEIAEDDYKIQLYDDKNKKTEEIIIESYNNIRPNNTFNKATVMQTSKLKIEGLDTGNVPVPYSFRGECAGGKGFIVPFGGIQKRDGLFYPNCEKLTGTNKKQYIEHIINGFPLSSEEEQKFNISTELEYDYFSGIFKKGTTDLGSSILIRLPKNKELLNKISGDVLDYFNENSNNDDYIIGKLIDKYKTFNNKLDNYVIYKVDIGNDNIIEITGNDFHPKYIENRIWKGVLAKDANKKIIECANKLGLVQTPLETKNIEDDTKNMVLKKLKSIIKINSHYLFTRNNAIDLTKIPHLSISVNSNSQRAFLFFYKELDSYFIVDKDLKNVEKLQNMEKGIMEYTCVLDGYLSKINKYNTYHTIDCIYYNNDILKLDYFIGIENEPNYFEKANDDFNVYDSDEEISDYEDVDIDLNDLIGKVNKNKLYKKEYEYTNKLNINLDNYVNLLENGRLFYSILLTKIIKTLSLNSNYKFVLPNYNCAPKIDLKNITKTSENSIIDDTKNLLSKKNIDLIFIPFSGEHNILYWKSNVLNTVTLEIIDTDYVKKSTNKNVTKVFNVGLYGEELDILGKINISLSSTFSKKVESRKGKVFMRFIVNTMSNGKLNPTEPLLLESEDIVSDPKIGKLDVEKKIDYILNPITKNMLNSNKWNFGKFTLVPNEDNPGTTPLAIK